MLASHKQDPAPSALVFINSFDYEKEGIEDIMVEQKIYAEVFEIDRIKQDQRLEYLNCFHKMFKTRELPMVFLKDQFIGNLSAVQKHFV